jgi:hypothetical protein
MNCFQWAKDLIDGKLKKNTDFVAIEGETHFCDFLIHTNNYDCDRLAEIDTRFVR